MTRYRGRRTPLGTLLVLGLGALAIFVLPGLASAEHGSSDSTTTIESFDPETRALVLSLPAGETVSGTVTRRTKIRCEDQRGHHGRGHDRVRGREAEPGDDRGGHGGEADDDHGGREAEPGDDRGGDSSGPGSGQSGPSGHDDNGSGANCGVADLIPGAAVEEVDLDFGLDSVRFDEVELAG